MAKPRLRYALLDLLLGAGLVSDFALRSGSRYGIGKVLRRERAGGDELGQALLGGLDAAGALAAQHLADPVERARAQREVGDDAGAEQAIEERISEPWLCHRD